MAASGDHRGLSLVLSRDREVREMITLRDVSIFAGAALFVAFILFLMYVVPA